MNKKQYNNVIDWTVNHEQSAQTEDGLGTARAIFNNMGVALPNGDVKEVYETIKTDNYMGWKSCTMQEAQQAADNGIAAIGISEDRIVVLCANDEEEPVTETASVMTLSENTSAYAVDGLAYYSYSNGTSSCSSGNQNNAISFVNSNLSVDVGWEGYEPLQGNPLPEVYWSSSNTSVASVDFYSGYITAQNAGVATITARCASDLNNSASFEIWVRGKTPVFLIHGRTSNSETAWGIKTNIPEGKNDHFDASVSANALNGLQYTTVAAQSILHFLPDIEGTERPHYLGNKLRQAGYKANINMFVFNYPNEDAVVHSARKFYAYINNLIVYVRNEGTDEMKACFYASRNDYNEKKYKINLIGHSMGGLVARYYIENLNQDYCVDKLITICTPHWGSGYADAACISGGDVHKLCDHDLRLDSKMYGGSFSEDLNCNALGVNCYNGDYKLTKELKYSYDRHTKYYAIAGVDYPTGLPFKNDVPFEMPTNFTNYQQIIDYFTEKGIFSFNSTDMSITKINPSFIGDNLVGFLGQIGWTENTGDTPNKKIQMERIFINTDTDGGNSVFDRFHSKMPCRKYVTDQVMDYLKG